MKLFHSDSPMMRGLGIMTDLMLGSLWFCLCSLPVFTMGAAMTAMCKVCQNVAYQEGGGVTKAFFHSFRENFMQATLLWLLAMPVMGVLIFELFMVGNMMEGQAQLIGFCLWLLPMLICFGILSWLFPLIARYENTGKGHLKNALSLAFAALPKTVLMVAVGAIPGITLLLNTSLFFKSSLLWVLVGFGALCFINNALAKTVFKVMEGTKDKKGDDPEATE